MFVLEKSQIEIFVLCSVQNVRYPHFFGVVQQYRVIVKIRHQVVENENTYRFRTLTAYIL